MRDLENVLDLVDGRLTRITIKWPETWRNVWKEQKHVRFALEHPKEAKGEKVLMKIRDWMVVQVVTHQSLDEEFIPIINIISEYFGDRPQL